MKKITTEYIKENTINLIKEKGYNQVTIMDICDKCQITKPTFYKYAGSKEELLSDFYDSTINNIIQNPYNLVAADSHYEQLLWIFSQIMKQTIDLGADLFSQMLIANLNSNYHSFDMRNSLTDLCVIIIKKSQESREILNMTDPTVLYHTAAYTFMGLETTWCLQNGDFPWAEEFYTALNTLLNVSEPLQELYKKFI